MIVGTLQYMAPEQLEGKPADARTDVFALGAVLFEMMTGRKAFEAQTQASLIAKILETDPPELSRFIPVAPPALERLVQRCLAKSPDDRWQSVRDVLLELRWIQEDRHKRGPAAAEGARLRRWLPWALTATAVLIAVSAWAARPVPR
jgi:eukaryotic-like serine/threonine-protein kinase